MGRTIPLVVVAFFGSCSRCSRGAASPQEAFRALQKALLADDPAAVFDALDLESRWSVESIHRQEREIWRLAKAHFPPEARDREVARYQEAGATSEARVYFKALGIHRKLRKQLGKASRRENAADGEVAFTTDVGGVFVVARGQDGSWRYVGLRDELERRKEHATNALAIVRKSAVQYDRDGAR